MYVTRKGDALSWMSVLVDGTYTVEGDRLTFRGPLAGKEARTVRIGFDGDRMTQINDGGERQEMTRVGPGEGVLGVWKSKHYTGQTAFQRFHTDGTTSFRLIMGTIIVQRYEPREEGTIELLAGKKMTSTRLQLRDGKLQSEDGKSGYVRVGAEPWYPLP